MGEGVTIVKERLHAIGAGVAAAGLLDGTFGATAVFLV